LQSWRGRCSGAWCKRPSRKPDVHEGDLGVVKDRRVVENDVVGNDSVIVGAPTVHGGRLSRIGVGIRRYAKVAFGLVSGLDCE
jgi:hypothetical protein